MLLTLGLRKPCPRSPMREANTWDPSHILVCLLITFCGHGAPGLPQKGCLGECDGNRTSVRSAIHGWQPHLHAFDGFRSLGTWWQTKQYGVCYMSDVEQLLPFRGTVWPEWGDAFHKTLCMKSSHSGLEMQVLTTARNVSAKAKSKQKSKIIRFFW